MSEYLRLTYCKICRGWASFGALLLLAALGGVQYSFAQGLVVQTSFEQDSFAQDSLTQTSMTQNLLEHSTPSQNSIKQQLLAKTDLKRILFSGNSFSFYNNGIHNHLGSLIRSADKWVAGENRFRLLTLSGGHIHEQLPLLEAMLLQKNANWQAIVLQAHSNEAVAPNKQKLFQQSLAKAVNLLKQHKVLPILFMTWEYEGDTTMGDELAYQYQKVAQKLQVPVVPVGLAFAKSQLHHPDIRLYKADVLGVNAVNKELQLSYKKSVKHPSEAGTYLTACVFYATLYNQSPEGLLFTASLSAKQAAKLQKVAWQTVREFLNEE